MKFSVGDLVVVKRCPVAESRYPATYESYEEAGVFGKVYKIIHVDEDEEGDDPVSYPYKLDVPGHLAVWFGDTELDIIYEI